MVGTPESGKVWGIPQYRFRIIEVSIYIAKKERIPSNRTENA
jgi:hypothetical protein